MFNEHVIFGFAYCNIFERPNANSFVIDIIMRYYSPEFEITAPEVNMAKSCRCQINFAIIFYLPVKTFHVSQKSLPTGVYKFYLSLAIDIDL